MLLCDVNVLVHAQRNESGEDGVARQWLEDALNAHEAVGVSELVLSAMTRIVTHPRVFAEPSRPIEAIAFADAVLEAPAASVVRPGARHWAIFRDLVTDGRLRGNDVPDAYLAAIALEAGARMVTRDSGFKRFGLQTVNPWA